MPTAPSRTAAPSKSARSRKPARASESAQQAPVNTWQDDPEKRELMIRLAAYSFYERRGCVSGNELEDWLQAEMEVDRQLARQTKPDDQTP